MTSTIKTMPLGGGVSIPVADMPTRTMPMGQAQTAETVPKLKITQPIKLANCVSSNAKQHIVFVRDTSSSMSGSKITELNIATSGLVTELAMPENKNGFIASVIDFNSSATRVVFADLVSEMHIPEAASGGGTNFNRALKETIKTLKDFDKQPNPGGWRYLHPHVIFLSDGQASVDDKHIANLHALANVTAVAYGSDAHVSTLSKIDSDGQVQVVGTSGGELRQFLAAVGQTLSQEFAKK